MIQRILYLPIIEPGAHHKTALTHKRGLYDALSERATVIQYDYLDDRESVYETMHGFMQSFQPDMIVSQFHGADILSPEQIRAIRVLRPECIWVNWSGDSWAHSLNAPDILAMAKEFDWQLVVIPDTLPDYAAAGVNAAYWQIAYEPPVMPLPDVPEYDIVFLANANNPERLALMEFLRSLPYKVGIYGDWPGADGNNVYHFAEGEALYQKATVAIADNSYTHQRRCVSNRAFQITGAGGAIMLHQQVENMHELTGWVAGDHYLSWNTLDDLRELIEYCMSNAEGRYMLAKPAQFNTLSFHTYRARVWQLFNQILQIPQEAAIP